MQVADAVAAAVAAVVAAASDADRCGTRRGKCHCFADRIISLSLSRSLSPSFSHCYRTELPEDKNRIPADLPP